MKRKILVRRACAAVGVAAVASLGLIACSSEADTVSYNLSEDADNFQVQRRIVFYNGITDAYILEVQGLCSLGNQDSDRRLSVTCKVGPDAYKKHYLGLSDNVTFFAEQTESADVSEFYYHVNFKPQEIIPDVDFRGTTELPESQ